jgi:four helix bundle protein
MNDGDIDAKQIAWERTCHPAITSDVSWKLDAYRSALFLLDLVHEDLRFGARRGLDPKIAAQLLYSVGSVSGNIGEGYSRSTRADRIRFFGYALGSLRECVSWYQAAKGTIEPATVSWRLSLVAKSRALLLGLIRSTRERGTGAHKFEP